MTPPDTFFSRISKNEIDPKNAFRGFSEQVFYQFCFFNYTFLHTCSHVCLYNSTMNQSNGMILDARESRDHQLSPAPKITRILQQVFAGDYFEKEMYSDK